MVVGVLCERIKVEEKWLIAVLAEAGIPARQLPPASSPLPIDPSPSRPSADEQADGSEVQVPNVVIDRCSGRAVAAATIPWLSARGAQVMDGGLAAAEDRLRVARALGAAGIPRPRTLVATSEESGLAAVRALGVPATLLPSDPGEAEIPFVDIDIAEAVLEHRDVLGGTVAAIALVQGGAREAGSFVDVLVIDGCAVACSQQAHASLAERAADVLGAKLLGVTIAEIAGGLVVWDTQPVPLFRDCLADDACKSAVRAAFLDSIGRPQQRMRLQDRVVQMPLVVEVIEGVTVGRDDGSVLIA